MYTLNKYTCDLCGCRVITRQEVEGTTPFMIQCIAPGCKGLAQSSMGSGVHSSMKPTYEWYRPHVSLYNEFDVATIDHLNLGGLLYRLIDNVWEEDFGPDSILPCALCGKKEKIKHHKLGRTQLCFKHRKIAPATAQKFMLKQMSMRSPLGEFGLRYVVIDKETTENEAVFAREEHAILFLESYK